MGATPGGAEECVFTPSFGTAPPCWAGMAWNSLTLAARVCLNGWEIRSMAQSSGCSSQWSLPGARYFTLVTRLTLSISWKVAAPFGQRVP